MFNRTPTNIEVDVNNNNSKDEYKPRVSQETEIVIETKSIANQMHTSKKINQNAISKIKMPTKQLAMKVESSPEVDEPDEDQEHDFVEVTLQSIKQRQDSLRHRKSSYIGSSVDSDTNSRERK